MPGAVDSFFFSLLTPKQQLMRIIIILKMNQNPNNNGVWKLKARVDHFLEPVFKMKRIGQN